MARDGFDDIPVDDFGDIKSEDPPRLERPPLCGEDEETLVVTTLNSFAVHIPSHLFEKRVFGPLREVSLDVIHWSMALIEIIFHDAKQKFPFNVTPRFGMLVCPHTGKRVQLDRPETVRSVIFFVYFQNVSVVGDQGVLQPHEPSHQMSYDVSLRLPQVVRRPTKKQIAVANRKVEQLKHAIGVLQESIERMDPAVSTPEQILGTRRDLTAAEAELKREETIAAGHPFMGAGGDGDDNDSRKKTTFFCPVTPWHFLQPICCLSLLEGDARVYNGTTLAETYAKIPKCSPNGIGFDSMKAATQGAQEKLKRKRQSDKSEKAFSGIGGLLCSTTVTDHQLGRILKHLAANYIGSVNSVLPDHVCGNELNKWEDVLQVCQSLSFWPCMLATEMQHHREPRDGIFRNILNMNPMDASDMAYRDDRDDDISVLVNLGLLKNRGYRLKWLDGFEFNSLYTSMDPPFHDVPIGSIDYFDPTITAVLQSHLPRELVRRVQLFARAHFENHDEITPGLEDEIKRSFGEDSKAVIAAVFDIKARTVNKELSFLTPPRAALETIKAFAPVASATSRSVFKSVVESTVGPMKTIQDIKNQHQRDAVQMHAAHTQWANRFWDDLENGADSDSVHALHQALADHVAQHPLARWCGALPKWVFFSDLDPHDQIKLLMRYAMAENNAIIWSAGIVIDIVTRFPETVFGQPCGSVIVGPGGNGKSELLEWVRKILRGKPPLAEASRQATLRESDRSAVAVFNTPSGKRFVPMHLAKTIRDLYPEWVHVETVTHARTWQVIIQNEAKKGQLRDATDFRGGKRRKGGSAANDEDEEPDGRGSGGGHFNKNADIDKTTLTEDEVRMATTTAGPDGTYFTHQHVSKGLPTTAIASNEPKGAFDLQSALMTRFELYSTEKLSMSTHETLTRDMELQASRPPTAEGQAAVGFCTHVVSLAAHIAVLMRHTMPKNMSNVVFVFRKLVGLCVERGVDPVPVFTRRVCERAMAGMKTDAILGAIWRYFLSTAEGVETDPITGFPYFQGPVFTPSDLYRILSLAYIPPSSIIGNLAKHLLKYYSNARIGESQDPVKNLISRVKQAVVGWVLDSPSVRKPASDRHPRPSPFIRAVYELVCDAIKVMCSSQNRARPNILTLEEFNDSLTLAFPWLRTVQEDGRVHLDLGEKDQFQARPPPESKEEREDRQHGGVAEDNIVGLVSVDAGYSASAPASSVSAPSPQQDGKITQHFHPRPSAHAIRGFSGLVAKEVRAADSSVPAGLLDIDTIVQNMTIESMPHVAPLVVDHILKDLSRSRKEAMEPLMRVEAFAAPTDDVFESKEAKAEKARHLSELSLEISRFLESAQPAARFASLNHNKPALCITGIVEGKIASISVHPGLVFSHSKEIHTRTIHSVIQQLQVTGKECHVVIGLSSKDHPLNPEIVTIPAQPDVMQQVRHKLPAYDVLGCRNVFGAHDDKRVEAIFRKENPVPPHSYVVTGGDPMRELKFEEYTNGTAYLPDPLNPDSYWVLDTESAVARLRAKLGDTRFNERFSVLSRNEYLRLYTKRTPEVRPDDIEF